jgi:hypothetical protein
MDPFSLALYFVVFCCFVLLVTPSGNSRRKRMLHDDNSSAVSASFSFSVFHLYNALCCAPIFGMLACLFVSVVFHFEDTTYTHCKVMNFLPSISAAIGNNQPEQFIWELAVAAHNIVTLVDSFVFYHNLMLLYPSRYLLARLCCFFKGWSSFSLFVLTFVTSTENFEIHKLGFVMWVIAGSISMVLMLVLYNEKDVFVLRWMRSFVAGYFVFIILAALFYYLHNWHCIPLAYSFFGLSEFIVIICYIFAVGYGPTIMFYNERSRVVILKNN